MKAVIVTFCFALVGVLGCAYEMSYQTPTDFIPEVALSKEEQDAKRREEIHAMMLRGEHLHDGSIDLAAIGDMSSVPALMNVLKVHPPDKNGGMACVTDHALVALRKITGQDAGITYEKWNAVWTEHQAAKARP
jgi:NADPH-dependent ferric siderophore reductase